MLFEEQEGSDGLEKSFDRDLQGRPGLINVLFNPDGTKVKEEVLRRPLPGNNVVTTLDCDFQKYAEEALAKHTTGGAMVILNVRTGEILAMASFPLFDPNLFVPSPTARVYQQLLKDKTMPLYPRAFQGEYPPASTFKVVVALAGLESGAITPRTPFNCVTAFQVGDRVFHNWSKEGEGEMNVVTAIKRSCNTWFYQAGLATGGGAITNMAMRMGFGERTGVPLAERPGFVPTDSWMQQHFGHRNLGGDVANLSIGQGRTLVTPLQAAQCMAALADGTIMPQVRLVMQVQDLNDHVLQAFTPAVRRRVELKPIARDPVVKGMIAVVNGAGGTGQAAGLDDKFHCQLAGKTGTAQWKPNEERRLAWFTGFLPANDPLYAYAVVYEGEPGEEISGGKKAAPIVNEVFTKILNTGSPDEPLVLLAQNKEAAKAVEVTDEDEESDGAPDGESAAQNAPPLPPQQTGERRGVAGFFHRLFGK
jgi:penicillin-binding protein 2